MEKTETLEVKKPLLADLSLLLVALLWGGGFIATKNSLDFIDPIYLTFLRFTLAFLLLALIFIGKLRKMTLSDLKAGSIIGFLLYVAFITQTVGLKYTTVSKQAFITASNVVMVPFIAWAISKSKPDKFEVFAAILCFLGIGILSLENNLKLNLGDSLTLICAIFFALHISAIGKYSKYHDPILLTILQFGVTAILSLITCIVFKIEFAPVSKEVGRSLAYIAFASTIIAFGLQNIAQKYTSSTHTAIILSFESVFGAILSIIFLNEKFTLKLFLGCITILLAVITAETKWSFLKNKNGDS